jgi:hypothetical protein
MSGSDERLVTLVPAPIRHLPARYGPARTCRSCSVGRGHSGAPVLPDQDRIGRPGTATLSGRENHPGEALERHQQTVACGHRRDVARSSSTTQPSSY